MLIRTEIGVDAADIDALLRRSFTTEAEAELVRELREEGLLTLGVVAADDEGQVLGYGAYSPVTVNGEDKNWVALAPLVVDQPLRNQGIGQQLVQESLTILNEFGYGAVVVLGEPALYGARYGFEPALHHQVRCKWPGTEAAFQIYKLADNAFSGTEGYVEYAAPFSRFD
ncbi:GNAT family N-acetyltransferase [Enterobacteriaceae bacterium LUAb1]